MKKLIVLVSIISILSCAQNGNHNKIDEKKSEEFRVDTEILESLNDSLNSTGDYQYFNKYIVKIDEMIIKYPDQKEELRKVKESMQEIFEE